VYTTVVVVLTNDNEMELEKIVECAKNLGVHDIRVIPAAQHSRALQNLPESNFPILEYRRKNINSGVRGLQEGDCRRCHLVLDDMAVIGSKHYPCIIYAREGGKPIGNIGPSMREERKAWSLKHDSVNDPICSKNCLDVCRDYNKQVENLAAAAEIE
jgi:MoaA/NifB/PqqE/SkfB family radical SAM enzyme